MDNRESPPKMPRWVKVFGVIVIVLLLVFVIIHLLGGEHGPGRHISTDDFAGFIALVIKGKQLS
ncbi:hypothetical protein N0O92_14785 [Alkalihalobacillus sp. MEB130]|uniref:hypothetical protein n=1 Tax=Alkalihalobacillus sp. MEB130 TaxID=2976704 RepID=UPI0028DDA399|nr:hypothetical protein [Alkalihalobacillus sp. MEB130]MDT8861483.1 hypothetical protein [Alkalihalobacillus sp. MEB130]